jgi:hypothetical protein
MTTLILLKAKKQKKDKSQKIIKFLELWARAIGVNTYGIWYTNDRNNWY